MSLLRNIACAERVGVAFGLAMRVRIADKTKLVSSLQEFSWEKAEFAGRPDGLLEGQTAFARGASRKALRDCVLDEGCGQDKRGDEMTIEEAFTGLAHEVHGLNRA